MNYYYHSSQDWIGAMSSFMGFMVMGTFMVAVCRDITKSLFEPEKKREFLPQTKEMDSPRYKSYKVGDYIYDRTELSRRGRIVEVIKGPHGDIYITERPNGFRDRIFIADALPLQMESLPSVTERYQLARTSPKFEPAKRVYKNKLYVLEKTEFPITGKGKFRNYYTVVSPKAYLLGYFPHVDLLGEYLPNRNDLFILDIHGFFSLERELPVTGTNLKDAMERRGVFKAYLVTKGTEASLSFFPGVIAMPKLPEEARKDFFFVEYIRDMLRLGEPISDEDAKWLWEGWKKSREEDSLRQEVREYCKKYKRNPLSDEAIREFDQIEVRAKAAGLSDREFERLWTAEVERYFKTPGYLPQLIPEQMELMEKYLELARGLAKSAREATK
ncbi:MAG: hypothetical protein U9R04_01200 [Chloroflexota bacterium]|nr:hypothetical protein [Chloroflexota bacterium]